MNPEQLKDRWHRVKGHVRGELRLTAEELDAIDGDVKRLLDALRGRGLTSSQAASRVLEVLAEL